MNHFINLISLFLGYKNCGCYSFITIICNYNYFSKCFNHLGKRYFLHTGNELTIAVIVVEGFFWIVCNIQYDIKRLSKKILIFYAFKNTARTPNKTLTVKEDLVYRIDVFLTDIKWHGPIWNLYIARYPIIRYGEINFNSKRTMSSWADILIGKDTVYSITTYKQQMSA